MNLEDFLWAVFGNLLDIHSTLGGNHDQVLAYLTIQEDRAVILVRDVASFFNQDTLDNLASLTGLNGDQAVPQQPLGHVVGRIGDIAAHAGMDHRHPTQWRAPYHDGFIRRGIMNGTLTTASGVNLRLDHNNLHAMLCEVAVGDSTGIFG